MKTIIAILILAITFASCSTGRKVTTENGITKVIEKHGKYTVEYLVVQKSK